MNTKKSFITRVCENISRFAKKEAVKVGDVSMTYSELDEKSAIISNRLNEHLASVGVPAGQPVRIGVFMNKSEWLVPSVWDSEGKDFSHHRRQSVTGSAGEQSYQEAVR